MPRLHAASIVGLVVSVKKKGKTISDTSRLATDPILDIVLAYIALYCMLFNFYGIVLYWNTMPYMFGRTWFHVVVSIIVTLLYSGVLQCTLVYSSEAVGSAASLCIFWSASLC